MLARTMREVVCYLLLWLTVAAASSPPGCDDRVDLVFLMDTSESLREGAPSDQPLHNYEMVKDFCKRVVQRLGVDAGNSRVAMVQYASHTEVAFLLGEHATSIQVQDAITTMEHTGGNTNTAAALRRMHRDVFRGARAGSKKVAVVLTDGLSNTEQHLTAEEAVAARGTGIEIYTVAATKYIDRQELFNISSQPADTHILHVVSYGELEEIVEVLVHRICGLPDPTTPPPPQSCTIEGCALCPNEDSCEQCLRGWYQVRSICRPCLEHCDICSDSETCDVCEVGWYWDPTTNTCEECELIADLTLLIDVSGSIKEKNPDNYELLKEFIKSLVQRLDVRADKIRLAAVRFSNSAWPMFHLNSFSSRNQINEAIDGMKYGGGHTNTSGAIRVMRHQIFDRGLGDRAGVPNVALVITDGESNKDQNLTLPEADLAKAEGITFFVVGVTDEINEDEVRGIASEPDEDHYFESPDIKHLDQLLFQILKEVCDPQNTAALHSRVPASDGDS